MEIYGSVSINFQRDWYIYIIVSHSVIENKTKNYNSINVRNVDINSSENENETTTVSRKFFELAKFGELWCDICSLYLWTHQICW